ncbi:unnamed protein product [Dovyalis caffra]|uniref:Uncharacterized protein n=1 Tax=Dovyalis caffra TaxID=77055 RepID=A0AAV1ST45_9ROSI|nr:unnamed protein product [Dovyalis caffra]
MVVGRGSTRINGVDDTTLITIFKMFRAKISCFREEEHIDPSISITASPNSLCFEKESRYMMKYDNGGQSFDKKAQLKQKKGFINHLDLHECPSHSHFYGQLGRKRKRQKIQ